MTGFARGHHMAFSTSGHSGFSGSTARFETSWNGEMVAKSRYWYMFELLKPETRRRTKAESNCGKTRGAKSKLRFYDQLVCCVAEVMLVFILRSISSTLSLQAFDDLSHLKNQFIVAKLSDNLHANRIDISSFLCTTL